MKKLFCFLAVAGSALFTSCSSDDDNGTGDGGNTVTEITLSSNINTVVLGEGSFTFTVADQDGNDLTSSSEILVNDVAIEGSTWEPTEAGTFTVEATYEDLTSNVVTVTVTEPAITPENSAVVGMDEFVTDNSILYYLGSDLDAGLSYFVANPYNVVMDGEEETYPNDVYIYFTSTQTSETTIDLPEVTAYTMGDDVTANSIYNVEVTLNSEELATEIAGVTAATMDMTAFEASETAETWAFDYSLTLTNGDVVNGNYNGNWGFVNASGRPAANNKMKVISLSKNQIAAKKAQFVKNLKK